MLLSHFCFRGHGWCWQGLSSTAHWCLLKLLHDVPIFPSPHGVLEGGKGTRQMDPNRHVLTFRRVQGIGMQSPEGSLCEKKTQTKCEWQPQDIYLQLMKGKCSLDAKVIKSNQKLEVNTKIMHAFMVSIFIYSLLLESDEPHSKHNSAPSCLPSAFCPGVCS